LYIKKLLTLFL